jgi:ribose-phosphate pyrophosphokinase
VKNSILLSTRSNKVLSKKVAAKLDIKLCNVRIVDFADAEISVEVLENIRRQEVFIIAGTSTQSNKNVDIMELMLLIDAVKRSSPERITVLFPYLPYARQDRRIQRSPISSSVFAQMLSYSGIDSVIATDLHTLQIQGFFSNNVVCEHISTLNTLKNYIKDNNYDCIVAGDIGGTSRARYFANLLNLPIAIIDKRRPEPGVSKVMHIIGDVKGKRCCIVDDIVDGGGTLVGATNALLAEKAKSVDAVIVHGVFSKGAITRLDESSINTLYISNSIEQIKKLPEKIQVVDIDDLLAETIRRFCNGESLKALVS